MKKLLFVFIGVFTLMLSGCGTQNESTNGFGNNTNTSENSENTENKTSEEANTENSPEANTESNSDSAEPVMVENSEQKTAEPTTVTTKNTELKITSFQGGNLETDQPYNVVRGTTPKNTYSIEINGYKLQKYYPGQTGWSYIAGEKYKTLKAGKNNYTVKALDKSGKEIASTNFSINYTELDEHKLPNVGSSAWLSLILTLSIMAGYLLTRQKNPL